MIKLSLTPKSRTMTRKEWKEAYHWLRLVQRTMQPYEKEIMDKVSDQMANLLIFGRTDLSQ